LQRDCKRTPQCLRRSWQVYRNMWSSGRVGFAGRGTGEFPWLQKVDRMTMLMLFASGSKCTRKLGTAYLTVPQSKRSHSQHLRLFYLQPICQTPGDISCLRSNLWGKYLSTTVPSFLISNLHVTIRFSFAKYRTYLICNSSAPFKTHYRLSDISNVVSGTCFFLFFGSDEGIAIRDRGTCGSGLWSVWNPGAVSGVLRWFR